MSLQICPVCKKENPYWKIYKTINGRFDKKMSIICTFCNNEMIVDIDIKNKKEVLFRGFFWMSFPIAIIFLAYFSKISYTFAFISVIAFHFLAMFYIIKKMKFKK